MNTKKLFMLLAAVLLSSVSAIAQSGNNEPLKGDVNEDGTVDVADLVNVIKIMKDAGGAVGEKMCYWYAGTNNGNAVTADNFTDVASRIPESEIPETGSVTANGQYIYFVMPETWHVESITYANGSAVEITCTDVMGYHIYKTSEMINTTINYTIKQTIYYWYVGTSMPSSVDTANIQSSAAEIGWHNMNASASTLSVGQCVVDTSSIWYVCIPVINNSAFTKVLSGGIDVTAGFNVSTETISGVSYKVFVKPDISKKFKYDFSK